MYDVLKSCNKLCRADMLHESEWRMQASVNYATIDSDNILPVWNKSL